MGKMDVYRVADLWRSYRTPTAETGLIKYVLEPAYAHGSLAAVSIERRDPSRPSIEF